MTKIGMDSVFEAGVLYMWPITSFILVQMPKKTSVDAHHFSNTVLEPFIQYVLYKARPEGHSRHSERNIRGTCTILCHGLNRVAPLKRGDFSKCFAPRHRNPKRVPPGNF
jgi:hypothetical protein